MKAEALKHLLPFRRSMWGSFLLVIARTTRPWLTLSSLCSLFQAVPSINLSNIKSNNYYECWESNPGQLCVKWECFPLMQDSDPDTFASVTFSPHTPMRWLQLSLIVLKVLVRVKPHNFRAWCLHSQHSMNRVVVRGAWKKFALFFFYSWTERNKFCMFQSSLLFFFQGTIAKKVW